LNKNSNTSPDTCDIWGTNVRVVYKWQHPRKNLCIEITEYHKSGRCTVDRKFLIHQKPSIDEARLKKLWRADLVIDRKRFINWHGDKRDEKIDVFNYSTSSSVDEKLVRTEKDLEKIGQEILKFNFPQNILDELSFDPQEMYLIFGTYKGEVR